MRRGWHLHGDGVAGPNIPANQNDSHDTRLADKVSLRVPVEHCGHQPRLKPIELNTRVAQPRHFHHSLPAEPEPRSSRQPEQVDPARRDVLAKGTRRHGEPLRTQLVVEFAVDEMHLPQVGLGGITRDPRTVLNRSPQVRVTLNTQTDQKSDALNVALGERVIRRATHRAHDTEVLGSMADHRHDMKLSGRTSLSVQASGGEWRFAWRGTSASLHRARPNDEHLSGDHGLGGLRCGDRVGGTMEV